MLKYYDFSGVSFLVEKSFECENASENAAARFVQPGTLIHSSTTVHTVGNVMENEVYIPWEMS